jgi:hypothetical protein
MLLGGDDAARRVVRAEVRRLSCAHQRRLVGTAAFHGDRGTAAGCVSAAGRFWD